MRVVGAVASIVVLLGCGRLSFDAVAEDSSVSSDARTDAAMDAARDSSSSDATPDSITMDAGDAAPDTAMDAPPDVPDPPLLPFGAPVELTALNFGGHDHSASLTGDLLEVFYESARGAGDDIYTATRATPTSPWSVVTRVDDLSTGDDETSAEVSRDGLTIFFISDRTPTLGGSDIWMSTRATRGSPWRSPVHLPELSTSANEHNASVSADGLSIIVQSALTGDSDLYEATRPTVSAPWSVLTPIAGINSSASDAHGHLTTGRRILYFASNRAGGSGNRDLYMATRASPSDPFGAPMRIEELATSGLDDEPWVSDDGRYILFTSVVPGGRGLFESRRP